MDVEGDSQSGMAMRTPERKVVSILFADLVGFTPLSERLDAEDVATIQGAYFDAVRTVVSRHGGVVEKYIGDAVMAVFGVPRVREDDAARAIAAGLALTGAVAGISGSLGLPADALQVRVAVNSGEVFQAAAPSADSGLVTGDAVNVAARLQSEAAPGRVLVGPLTALLAADAVELEPSRQLTVKGKSEPLAAAHVVAMRPRRSRELAMGSLRAPLAGRDGELAALEGACAAVAGDGGALVSVIAPPGAGKSRLLAELAIRRRAAQPVLEAVVMPDALRPFDAVAQLLVAALKRAGGPMQAALAAAGCPPHRAAVLAEEAAALTSPDAAAAGEHDRDRIFRSWTETLRRLCPGAVWLVDDLHWSAADLRAFLLSAVEDGATVVAAARPSLAADHPEWTEHARLLELSPLAPAPAAQLARDLVGNAITPELGERIAAASDGNPLFIEELMRSWAGSGLIDEGPNGWRMLVEPDAIAIPIGIQAVYSGQLDDLPEDARRLTRLAAVCGRRFAAGALGALGIDAAGGALDTIQRRGLVSGPAEDPVLGPTYSFRHALLREAAYGTLTRSERARLHAALADWLAAREGDRGETAELVARHLRAALREAPALGAEIAPGLTRDGASEAAARWFEQAAAAAAAGTARETAAGLLREALELTAPEAAGDRARRLRLLGEVLSTGGDLADAGEALEQAQALLEGIQPLPRAEYAAAVAALAWVRHEQIRFREAAELAAAARRRIGDGDDTATGSLMLIQGLAEIAETDDAAWSELMEQALAIARSVGDRRLELQALRAVVPATATDAAGEARGWDEIEALASRLGEVEARVSAIRNRAIVRRFDGGRPDPRALDAAVKLAEAHGLAETVGWLDYAGSEMLFLDDDMDGALRLALSAVARGEARRSARLTVRAWFVALPILAGRPGSEPELRRAASFLRAVEREGVPESPYARIMVPAAWLHLAAGGVADARPPEPGDRMSSFRLAYGDTSWTLSVETVTKAWMDVGWTDAVAAALGELEQQLGRRDVNDLTRASFHLQSAQLAVAMGEPPAAVGEHARRASEAARGARAPRWERAAREVVSS